MPFKETLGLVRTCTAVEVNALSMTLQIVPENAFSTSSVLFSVWDSTYRYLDSEEYFVAIYIK